MQREWHASHLLFDIQHMLSTELIFTAVSQQCTSLYQNLDYSRGPETGEHLYFTCWTHRGPSSLACNMIWESSVTIKRWTNAFNK